jgi:light-regulated signal transduction histidine kinase (bacteriophytochrome)
MVSTLQDHAHAIQKDATSLSQSDTSTLDRLQAKCVSRIYNQAQQLQHIASNRTDDTLSALSPEAVQTVHESLTQVQGYAQMLKNMRAERLKPFQLKHLQHIIQQVQILCDRLDIVITQQQSSARVSN